MDIIGALLLALVALIIVADISIEIISRKMDTANSVVSLLRWVIATLLAVGFAAWSYAAKGHL